MRRVAEPLVAMGATVTTAPEGTPPVVVSGRRDLRGIEWTLPVASAQVKSAILLAALGAEGETVVIEPGPSRDHTERLLRHCGVDVGANDGTIALHPGKPKPFGLRVPGDISSTAFLFALAAARSGWRMRCASVGVNERRTGVLDVLRAMGASVEVGDVTGDVEPAADVSVRGAELTAVRIAGELTVRCIDELPVIAVLATQAEGTTEIRDAGELRSKESDRIAALVEGLRAFGARCEALDDGLAVAGPSRLRAARVDAAGDHRLAMAWAVAGALCDAGETTVVGADAVDVSYPGFFDELARVSR
jgi:3-phosphoshikimate 1-carboxyvinyltransferase